jgi:hypothetical protein
LQGIANFFKFFVLAVLHQWSYGFPFSSSWCHSNDIRSLMISHIQRPVLSLDRTCFRPVRIITSNPSSTLTGAPVDHQRQRQGIAWIVIFREQRNAVAKDGHQRPETVPEADNPRQRMLIGDVPQLRQPLCDRADWSVAQSAKPAGTAATSAEVLRGEEQSWFPRRISMPTVNPMPRRASQS